MKKRLIEIFDKVNGTKLSENVELNKLEGGLADNRLPEEFDSEQILKGMKVEMEHTNDPKIALEITMDHLVENPKYYDFLERMENSFEDNE